jgi:hypothetical protein
LETLDAPRGDELLYCAVAVRTGCGFRVEGSASPGRENHKIVLMKGFMCVVVITMKLDGETLPPSESQSNVSTTIWPFAMASTEA